MLLSKMYCTSAFSWFFFSSDMFLLYQDQHLLHLWHALGGMFEIWFLISLTASSCLVTSKCLSVWVSVPEFSPGSVSTPPPYHSPSNDSTQRIRRQIPGQLTDHSQLKTASWFRLTQSLIKRLSFWTPCYTAKSRTCDSASWETVIRAQSIRFWGFWKFLSRRRWWLLYDIRITIHLHVVSCQVISQ